MINIYPFASGSQYTASFAVTASWAASAQLISYVPTASTSAFGVGPSGSRGAPDICLITYEQYLALVANPTLMEVCNFPAR